MRGRIERRSEKRGERSEKRRDGKRREETHR
jgi:hypothetical protein